MKCLKNSKKNSEKQFSIHQVLIIWKAGLDVEKNHDKSSKTNTPDYKVYSYPAVLEVNIQFILVGII